jgi:ABC-type ATPase involved in cell division
LTIPNPGTIYNEKIKAVDELLKGLKKQDASLGVVKLVLAVVGLLGILRVFTHRPGISLGIFAGCFVLFAAVAVVHETVIRKIKYQKALKTIAANEIEFLHHRFPGHGGAGAEFAEPDHHYASDLDIFGEKGLFHYVNRAVTAVGKRWTAAWLKTQAGAAEVGLRQEAVRELAPLIDLRHTIAAHGMFIDDSSRKLDALFALLDEPFIVRGRKFLVGFMMLWPLVTLAGLVSLFFSVPLAVPLGMAVVQAAVNKKYFKRVSRIYGLTGKSHKILKAYSRIINGMERENHKSARLGELKKRLSVRDKSASLCIRRLSVLLEWFDTRNGMLHFIFNNILLWDLHCVYRIERWRSDAGSHVPDWFDVIGEFEALCGFAALHFNNPGWAFPGITAGPFQLNGVSLGHPLIPQKERVCNDVRFNETAAAGKGNLLIVTGPNMGGKSTFLRTVGVNTVLAFAGAPVCARRLEVSPLKLFTSMQTSDSLDRHLSLFYAELQRLKIVLDGISRGEPVFFLIDEILKGTNALDRQKGAIALLKQLMRSGANGIAATHDLQLTRLEDPAQWENYPGGINISNYHFDSYIEGDKLLFDYRLRPGVCQSFNALVLMKKMGIDI